MLALAAIARACAAISGTNSGRISLLSKSKYTSRPTPAGAETPLPAMAPPELAPPAAPLPASVPVDVPPLVLAAGAGALTALLPAQPPRASSIVPAIATMRFLCMSPFSS